MNSERLNDMLERYGEVCQQKTAAKILSIVPRTVARMMDDGRLRRVGKNYVDVRSICAYIENAPQADFITRAQRQPKPKLTQEDFLEAARKGRWAPKK